MVPHPYNLYAVSILVLVDVALEQVVVQDLVGVGCGFQSLFSWMSLLNVAPEPCRGCQAVVSILVLVDVALEPNSDISLYSLARVSILVLVDVALEPRR